MQLFMTIYTVVSRTIRSYRKRRQMIKRSEKLHSKCGVLRPYLGTKTTFLEIGPGDCSLSLEVANHVKQAYAVDVSARDGSGQFSFGANRWEQ